MDIKLPDSLLRQYLDTNAQPKELADCLSLCGPTVDRVNRVGDETIYDIEIITNRVDSASALGVARECAAILPQFGFNATLLNDPYTNPPKAPQLPQKSSIQVQILDHSLVSRFACIPLSVNKPKASPKQTQDWLTNSGIRSLNNVIDISNELTLRYGQPVHIFDLDKIKGQKLILRQSKKGEKISTLDGTINTLRGGDIVIEDGEGRLIDLCGIMGGSLSEVDNNTTNVLLFVMTYAGAPVRKTSLYLQKRTLAAQLFEKSLDEELVLPTLIHGIKLLQERCGGQITGGLLDIYPEKLEPAQLSLPLTQLKLIAGVDIQKEKIEQILNTLGFATHLTATSLTVTIPSFRRFDIKIPEDIIEEITRVFGYFRLPSTLPLSTLPLTPTDPILNDEVQLKHLFVSLGFTEIYNNSLVSATSITSAGESIANHISLSNPLSEDFQYLRTSLIPSLIQNLSSNSGKVNPPLQLFELANIYLPTDKLPTEQSTLAAVSQGLDYLDFKGLVDTLFASLHLHPDYLPLKKHHLFTSASLTISINGQIIGHLGQIHPEVCLAFGLSTPILALELNIQLLSQLLPRTLTFKPIPISTPQVRDITLSSKKSIWELINQLSHSDSGVYAVDYLYSREFNHTFRLQFYLPTGITRDHVDKLVSQIIKTTH